MDDHDDDDDGGGGSSGGDDDQKIHSNLWSATKLSISISLA